MPIVSVYVSRRAVERAAERCAQRSAGYKLASQGVPHPKQASRRPSKVTRATRALAEGEAADRDFFYERPWRMHFVRPVGEAELDGLLKRAGMSALPGVKRPRVYAVVCSKLDAEQKVIHRLVRTGLTARYWNSIVANAALGLFVREEAAARWAQPGAQDDAQGVYICIDTIAASAPSRESA